LRDVVRSRNPSKSTLAHDAVATAVLHKHHPIICVGAGLIQFVYRSHLRLATEATVKTEIYFRHFSRIFPASSDRWWGSTSFHGAALTTMTNFVEQSL